MIPYWDTLGDTIFFSSLPGEMKYFILYLMEFSTQLLFCWETMC